MACRPVNLPGILRFSGGGNSASRDFNVCIVQTHRSPSLNHGLKDEDTDDQLEQIQSSLVLGFRGRSVGRGERGGTGAPGATGGLSAGVLWQMEVDGWEIGGGGEGGVVVRVPTGPFPLVGGVAEAAADGVVVEVVDGVVEGLHGGEVAVVAGAFLPESEGEFAGTLTDGQLGEQRIVLLGEKLFDSVGKGTFDGIEEVLDLGRSTGRQAASGTREVGQSESTGRQAASGTRAGGDTGAAAGTGVVSGSGDGGGEDDEVDVFGHENEGKELEVVMGEGLVDAVGKEMEAVVAGQKGKTTIAGEGELVGMAGEVVVMDGFPVGKHEFEWISKGEVKGKDAVEEEEVGIGSGGQRSTGRQAASGTR